MLVHLNKINGLEIIDIESTNQLFDVHMSKVHETVKWSSLSCFAGNLLDYI